jgi:phage baseplate assembly protein V
MKVDFIGEIAGHRMTAPAGTPQKYDGVAIGTVINTLDSIMQGRVQLRMSIAPDLEPWASVASPMAGLGHGWYAMPQIGDQVVVAFNNGDLRQPYVIGAVWNATKRPPITLPSEAVNKRILRTPAGHQIEFDDATQALTVTSSTQQQVSLNMESVEVAAGLGAASIRVGTDGSVTISAATSIKLEATSISIQAAESVEIQAGASTTLNGGASCKIKGALVEIN